jgi:hypothetical protein
VRLEELDQSKNMTSSGFEPATFRIVALLLISGVGLWVLQPTTALLYQPRMIGGGDCGEIGGMKIGRGNPSTRRKPAPAPLCPSQIPYD